MGSDQDILSRLPDPPEPAAEAREAAIAMALRRFDDHAGMAGSPTPQRRVFVKTRYRYAMAACLVVGIATPLAWHYLGDSRQPDSFQMAAGTVRQAEPAPMPMKTMADTDMKLRADEVPRSAPTLSYAPPPPAQPSARNSAVAPGGAPSTTTPSSAWEACTAPEPETRIEGCTRLAEDQSQNQKLRAVAYLNRGAARAQRGELDLAIADYSEAITLDPAYAVAFYNRSLVHAAKGQSDQAAADRARAINIDPAYGAR
jgi:tetratricopeptide (TPR) repeat protein